MKRLHKKMVASIIHKFINSDLIGYKTIVSPCQSVLKRSYEYKDFSASWFMGNEWRVIETWPAVGYRGGYCLRLICFIPSFYIGCILDPVSIIVLGIRPLKNIMVFCSEAYNIWNGYVDRQIIFSLKYLREKNIWNLPIFFFFGRDRFSWLFRLMLTKIFLWMA